MRTLVGKVVSNKTTQTVTVLIESRRRHPLYKKVMKKTKKYAVHDELGVSEGDQVEIRECRPLSKTKKWKVVEIIKKLKTKD